MGGHPVDSVCFHDYYAYVTYPGFTRLFISQTYVDRCIAGYSVRQNNSKLIAIAKESIFRSVVYFALNIITDRLSHFITRLRRKAPFGTSLPGARQHTFYH